jgi:DnaA-homolog protein
MNNLKQLALNLCLKDAATFVNFFVGANKQLVNVLCNLDTDNETHFVYVWGKQGSGKSHLLSALCQLFGEHDRTVAYLPLEEVMQLDPQMLDDLEKLDLLCVDDLDLIAGNAIWEEKFFHCFNKIMEHGKQIVVTANATPLALPLALADLKSRMTSGLIFEAHALGDIEKIEGLKLRAKLRGLELNDVVAQFLLHRYARDTKTLFATLDQLDKAALAAQRKLTIPFVKSILG